MAKIITENFRIENANEFFYSFGDRNTAVKNEFEERLRLYNTALSGGDANNAPLSETNLEKIMSDLEEELIENIPESDYYILASSFSEDTPIANSQYEKRNFLRRVIFGTRLEDLDIKYMFDKNTWVSGTVYDAFDDTKDISEQNVYATVEVPKGEKNIVVYKCIRNGNGSPSIKEPDRSEIDNATDEIFSPEDGYVWKYMFTVPEADFFAYSTPISLPYIPDQTVISTAVQSVSDILIEETPTGLFSEFLLPNMRLVSVEQDSDVDNTYKLTVSTSVDVKSTPGAYKNMYLRFVNTGDLFEVLNSEVPTTSDLKIMYIYVKYDPAQNGGIALAQRLPASSECDISPIIKVTKSKGNNCIAFGLLNDEGTLEDIAFKSKGSEYYYAEAELVLPDSLLSRASETRLRAVISPRGGHGSNPIEELSMSKLAVITNFYNSIELKIPSSGTYTKVGLVKGPSFKNQNQDDFVPPQSIDNRFVVYVNSDVTGSIDVGSKVSQQQEDEVVSAFIHELQFENGVTLLYLVDHDGAFEGEFITGEVLITPPEGSTNDPSNININIITEAQASDAFYGPLYTQNTSGYVAYSGDLLHFVDFDPIDRDPTRREKVKFVFDF